MLRRLLVGLTSTITCFLIFFFILMVFLVRDEATRQFYVGLSAGSLFALPPALESLGLVGSKTEERAFLDKKLTEVYSPLHVMIVAMNEKVPREDALKHTTVGAYVSLPANEFERISAIFREHSHDLGNHHLKMWLSIEAEISRIGSPLKAFYLNKERQEWFDELEKEYQRLKKELEKRE